MKPTFEQLIEDAQRTVLTPEEKYAAKNALIRFTNAHPVLAVRTAPGLRHIWQRSAQTFLIRKPMIIKILATAGIALVVGGGTAYAAEGALPGDALFPVKIHVNERVRAAFAVSPEARARLETKLAERRLDEAAELAAEGRLNARARAEVQANFAAHADRVQEHIADLRARHNFSAAANVAARLETSLAAHEKILKRFAEEDATSTVGVSDKNKKEHESEKPTSEKAPSTTPHANARAEESTESETKAEVRPLLLDVHARHDAAASARVENESETHGTINLHLGL
ncbi:hypothetical protein HY065_02195 [Candidatus Berkelbacteria bacterium]|nr:hypothetical protein [Candidatus Berkelbacteria bacterium]